MKRLRIHQGWPLLLVAVACTAPDPRVKVIVGATSVSPRIQNSVVIVREGVVLAIGPQQTVPVPAASEKVNGLGKFVASVKRGRTLRPGDPADLVLLTADPGADPKNYDRVERMMKAGEWVSTSPAQ